MGEVAEAATADREGAYRRFQKAQIVARGAQENHRGNKGQMGASQSAASKESCVVFECSDRRGPVSKSGLWTLEPF
jgi:hypothetical protein